MKRQRTGSTGRLTLRLNARLTVRYGPSGMLRYPPKEASSSEVHSNEILEGRALLQIEDRVCDEWLGGLLRNYRRAA